MQRYFAKFSAEENRFFITGEDCRHIATSDEDEGKGRNYLC